MTKVYYTYLAEKLSEKEKNKIFKYADKLPEKRYEAYLELNDELSKIQNIIAYLLLSKILIDDGISLENLEFAYGDNGKPCFNDCNIKFNISHSKNVIAVAIAATEVGIDVEHVKAVDKRLINRVYSQKEQDFYHCKLADQDTFYKIWTIKESYSKTIGLGLNVDFTELSFDLESDLNRIDNLFIHSMRLDDFYLSVCSDQKNIELRKITIEQLLV
jgi:4'-phosphopantetheinyl transferase